MTRKDYIKQCITSAIFLVVGCNITSAIFLVAGYKYENQSDCILSRANDMLSNVWKVEYKSYTCHKDLQAAVFWDTICTELECEGLVYRVRRQKTQ